MQSEKQKEHSRKKCNKAPIAIHELLFESIVKSSNEKNAKHT